MPFIVESVLVTISFLVAATTVQGCTYAIVDIRLGDRWEEIMENTHWCVPVSDSGEVNRA